MKKTLFLALASVFASVTGLKSQTSCTDINEYPISKNIGGTGAYPLIFGQEEKAAQTYHYHGPGRVSGLRLHGYSSVPYGIPLDVLLCNVDASGRPTGIIGSKHITWYMNDNITGYKDVSFANGGYPINNDFAVAVQISGPSSSTQQFHVTYTGNGEGKGEDLASLAGPSTGNNWVSAKNNFSKDGDFYILPHITNYITAQFSASSKCITTGTAVSFTNATAMTTDSMFNTIGLAAYTGTDHFYTWDFGDGSAVSYATSPVHTYTAAGVYTVSLTAKVDDWNGGCSDTYTSRVSVGLSAGVPATTSVTCSGSKNGSFTVTPTGGAAPYTFSNDGNTYTASGIFNGLKGDIYTAYVKDAEGCVQTTTVNVAEPNAITFQPSTSTNASCNNADGALQTSAVGGVGTLQYSINGTTWQTSGNFNNLAAGGYTVTVKDANGCSTQQPLTVVNLGGPSLSIVSSTNVSCWGSNDASIIASATGGSGVLQYSLDGVNFQTSGSFTSLSADTFFVTVKDATGCKDIKTVIVAQPAPLGFAANMHAVACNGGNDGKIIVNNVSGGTGSMSYALNIGFFQSSNTFTGLSAGSYLVKVKDAAGCLATSTVTVTEPSAITASVTTSNAGCNNSTDGSLTAVASGGTPRYVYSIDGLNFYPTGNFDELTAGTYTIHVTDANGCTQTVTSTITQPAAITGTVTVGMSTCGNADGNILISAGGGSGSGYQYSIDGINWNGTGSFLNLSDSSYVLIVKDGAGCSTIFRAVVTNSNGPQINTVSSTNVTCNGGNNGSITVTNVTGGSGTLLYQVSGYTGWQTSPVFSGLPAGSHTVVVKDGLGCSGGYPVTLTEPSAIVVNTSVSNIPCSGMSNGSVTVTAGGGSGTLAYSLNGSVFQSNNSFTNLAAGTYVAYVRDAGSCIGMQNFTVVSAPPILISNVGTLDVTCNGSANGSFNVTASGGTGSLIYSLGGMTYQSSNTFTGLNGGNYTIYVKDNNNCIVTYMASVYEPTALVVSANTTNISCYGGHNGVINVFASGGSPVYSYSWSNQLGNSSYVNNLHPGTYSVTVMDENGCKKSTTATIIQPSAPLIVNATISNASSSTSADGTIFTTVTGGTAPYTYSWSNGVSTPNNTNILPGTYVVTITDANGCVTSGVFTVGSATGVQTLTGTINGLNLYPNPAGNYFTVESDDALESVEVMNLVGEVMFSALNAGTKITVDTQQLSDGVYFVRLKSANAYITKRVQIVK